MFDKLAAEETRYEQLMTEMADPSVQSDNARFRENSKALAEIQPLVEQFRRYKEVVSQIEAAQELLEPRGGVLGRAAARRREIGQLRRAHPGGA